MNILSSLRRELPLATGSTQPHAVLISELIRRLFGRNCPTADRSASSNVQALPQSGFSGIPNPAEAEPSPRPRSFLRCALSPRPLRVSQGEALAHMNYLVGQMYITARAEVLEAASATVERAKALKTGV